MEPVYGERKNRLRVFLTCSKSHSKPGTGLETHIRTSHEQRHRGQKYHPGLHQRWQRKVWAERGRAAPALESRRTAWDGGEGNGNPLQYSLLENPMDRGAWQATVPGIAGVWHDLATKPPTIISLRWKLLDSKVGWWFMQTYSEVGLQIDEWYN